MTGLVVLVVALAMATAFGLWRRRTDGRIRAAGSQPPAVELASLLAPDDPASRESVPPSELADLASLGQHATLLQFSSPACAPCRATRTILADIAASTPGVSHVEVDAAEHLGLTRSLGITRTPTVVFLDAEGRETHRAVGALRRQDVLATLGL